MDDYHYKSAWVLLLLWKTLLSDANVFPKKASMSRWWKMRLVTSMSKSGRTKRTQGPDRISIGQFRAAKRTMSSRLCGESEKLCHHIKSIKRMNEPIICAWCEVHAYSACGVCVYRINKLIPLHSNSKKGEGKDLICFY